MKVKVLDVPKNRSGKKRFSIILGFGLFLMKKILNLRRIILLIMFFIKGFFLTIASNKLKKK